MDYKKLYFGNDYSEGAHEKIVSKLVESNYEKTIGYGLDEYSELAKERIRLACNCKDAEVKFLVGGTQTNMVVIHSLLRSYQGVICADSGHINIHEAGAIEFGGNKILPLKSTDGKISAKQVEQYLKDYWNDCNKGHVVMPGMVYISQPTEYGTLYSKEELANISEICKLYNIPFYVDGARLAYALACEENDVSLADLANYCDAFYIGGTKCGALFGEAVVIPNPNLIPNFFNIIKQHGALLAKGRMLGIQFSELFNNNLYETIAIDAIKYANKIRQTLIKKGYKFFINSPTNQIFTIIENEKLEILEKKVIFANWEKYDENRTVIRFVTSWSTTEEDVNKLCNILDNEL